MSNLVIAAVPQTLVDIVWPKAYPHIKRVIDALPHELTMDGVYRRLKSGQQMMVAVCDGEEVIAAYILEVLTFDTGVKALYLPICGGDRMDEWLERSHGVVVAIAKDLGCTRLRGISLRPAWLRVLNNNLPKDCHEWQNLSQLVECKIGE